MLFLISLFIRCDVYSFCACQRIQRHHQMLIKIGIMNYCERKSQIRVHMNLLLLQFTFSCHHRRITLPPLLRLYCSTLFVCQQQEIIYWFIKYLFWIRHLFFALYLCTFRCFESPKHKGLVYIPYVAYEPWVTLKCILDIKFDTNFTKANPKSKIFHNVENNSEIIASPEKKNGWYKI